MKTREQYFPAMLYLSTSKLSVVVLGNLAFALTLVLGHLLKTMFLGTLREAEVERLYDRVKDAIMETCLAMTIFREEFNVRFVVLFTSLLFVKIFHWLCADRVAYIETTPSTTRLSHLRVCVLMVALVSIDTAFLNHAIAHTLKNGPSVLLLFGFEYVILASRVATTAAKYVVNVVDGWLDGAWESKGTVVFYLELLTDLLHLFVYLVFFLIIFAYYGLPVHLVRDLYVTIRNFRRRVEEFIRYRRVTANLNERFPDGSAEDLAANDDACIICREDMVFGVPGAMRPKKLPCGHLFHLGCLKSWLERQQACPTCRAPVLPEDRNAPPRPADPADAAVQAALNEALFGGGARGGARAAAAAAAAAAASAAGWSAAAAAAAAASAAGWSAAAAAAAAAASSSSSPTTSTSSAGPGRGGSGAGRGGGAGESVRTAAAAAATGGATTAGAAAAGASAAATTTAAASAATAAGDAAGAHGAPR